MTGSASTLTIGIADDHPIVRSALASALADLGPGARFVEASDAAGTVALVEAPAGLDLLLLDLHMPGSTGLETIRTLRERAPQVPLVIVSADEDPTLVAALMSMGVAGYLPKSEAPAVIVSAVRLVLAGGTYVPPRLMGSVSGAAGPDLTPRQAEVLKLLAQGLPNKSIANALGVTEGTVKVHLIAVFRALNVRNRTSAVLAAQRYLG